MIANPWLWFIAFLIAIYLNSKRVERNNAKAEQKVKAKQSNAKT